MTYKAYFDECTHNKGYQTIGHLQYKVVDNVLYFQCSHGTEDWKSNFDFPAVPYKNMSDRFLVHKGFILMWKQVRDIVSTLHFNTIVGYSQGAVFAALAYEDTLYNRNIKCACITFGCPRFLFLPSRKIQLRFADVLRIKNPTDIVSHVPPTLFGYRHIGHKQVLKNVAKKPGDVSWPVWLSGHSPDRYKQNLEVLNETPN